MENKSDPTPVGSDNPKHRVDAPSLAAAARGTIKGLGGFLKTGARQVSRGPAAPVHILVVDDEPPVRKFVQRVLGEAGHDIVVAVDGADALRLAPTMPQVDLLVTDLMMPGMSGDELARKLRQSVPGLKVLYLTGYSDRLFKEKVTLWEGEAFLDKPCSVQGLQQAAALLAFGHIVTSAETQEG